MARVKSTRKIKKPKKVDIHEPKKKDYHRYEDKPPYSYKTMITAVILMADKDGLEVKEINEALMEFDPFFRGKYIGWMQSVRHILSKLKTFYQNKGTKQRGLPWCLNFAHFADKDLDIQPSSVPRDWPARFPVLIRMRFGKDWGELVARYKARKGPCGEVDENNNAISVATTNPEINPSPQVSTRPLMPKHTTPAKSRKSQAKAPAPKRPRKRPSPKVAARDAKKEVAAKKLFLAAPHLMRPLSVRVDYWYSYELNVPLTYNILQIADPSCQPKLVLPRTRPAASQLPAVLEVAAVEEVGGFLQESGQPYQPLPSIDTFLGEGTSRQGQTAIEQGTVKGPSCVEEEEVDVEKVSEEEVVEEGLYLLSRVAASQGYI